MRYGSLSRNENNFGNLRFNFGAKKGHFRSKKDTFVFNENRINSKFCLKAFKVSEKKIILLSFIFGHLPEI